MPAPFNSLSRPDWACISIRKPNEALGKWGSVFEWEWSRCSSTWLCCSSGFQNKTWCKRNTRMCVTFAGKEEMAAPAKLFDLLLLALRRSGAHSRAQELQLYKRTEAENKYTTHFGLLFGIRVQNYLECTRLTFCPACDFVVYPLFCNL